MICVDDFNANAYREPFRKERAPVRKIDMPSNNPVQSMLDLGEPPEAVLDYARKEVGEDPETRCQVLEEFRDLIYERDECTPHRMDDAFLLRFLRARLFVVRHAHRMLVSYCEFREKHPEYFENVDLMHLKNIGEHDLITVPPYREQTGRRVLLYRIGLWDPAKFTIDELLQATMIILELAIIEQQAQIMGGICMFDLGGLTLQQAWHFTPSLAKTVFEIMVSSFPMKVHAVHILNQPWIFEMVFNLFKPLLNDEMKERLFIHSDNMESLHKHIDPKFLPERYGGVHPDYNYNDWIDFFKNDEKIRWELMSHGYTINEFDKEGENIEKDDSDS